jgi:hypothetical protein
MPETTATTTEAPRYVRRSRPDRYGRLRITTTEFVIVLAHGDDPELDPRARVYVDDAVSEPRSAELRNLTAKEKALSRGRRYAHRGKYKTVDALYDRLNAEIMRVKLGVARDALALLARLVDAGLVTGDLAKAIEGAEFSPYAGCTLCRCSPGVIAGDRLRYRGDAYVSMWVDALPAKS